jgi:hypothetical protein
MCRTSITRLPEHRAAPLAALLIAAIALGGCSREVAAPRTEQRGVDAFHSIDLRGAATLRVQVGPAVSVTATGSPAALARLGTRVENGKLVIAHEHGWSLFGGNANVELQIALPELHALAVNGAGEVTIHGVHGAALALVVQGAGNVEATGDAVSLNARINGAGNMDLSQLLVGDATVSVNGAGNLQTHVTGSLEASVNGVGSITYAGQPQHLDSHVNGIGSISPAASGGT